MINKIHLHLVNKFELYLGDKEISKRIISGSFWSILGGVLSKLIVLLGSILLARNLGETDFGAYGIVMSTISVFGMFSGAAMGLTATKYVSKYLAEGKTHKVNDIMSLVFSTSILLSIIFTVTLFLFSEKISTTVLANRELTMAIKIISISLIFSSINGVITGILSGFEKFKEISYLNIKLGLLNYPLVVLFTLLYGLNGAVLGYTISLFILSILSYQTLNKALNNEYHYRFNLKLIAEYKDLILNYTLPAIIGGAITAPIIWLSNILFINTSNGYSQLGIYQAGNQLTNVIVFFPTILSNILLPMLSSTVDKNQYKRIFKLNMLINIVISLIISLPLILFSNFFMGLFGDSYKEYGLVLIYLSLTSVAMAYNSVIGKAIASSGNMWYGFLFNLLWGAILIAGTYLTVKYSYGALGLAFTYLISYVMHSIWQTIYIKFKGLL